MEDAGTIRVFGAREHNLKNINVEVPRGAFTVITGPSGSGKSSLALDVLFAEGQRRYVESLSAYVRQFLGTSKRPDVDRIEGLCPAIAIEQKTVSSNPRSTVGTVTEIYDYLRVLFARIGEVSCPQCSVPVKAESVESVVGAVSKDFAGTPVTIVAPLIRDRKGEFTNELKRLVSSGWRRFIIDGSECLLESHAHVEKLKLRKTFKHTVDCSVDTVVPGVDETSRLEEAVANAFKLAGGTCKIITTTKEVLCSAERMCLHCRLAVPELEPRLFSFNSPVGACQECNGLGIVFVRYNIHLSPLLMTPSEYEQELSKRDDAREALQLCKVCSGARLNSLALAVRINGKNIHDVCSLSVRECLDFFNNLTLADTQEPVARPLLHEIRNRLGFLNDVGLSYLSVNRPARTLSGGEGQRIRLATQIGSALSGVMYVLDEPSIGLHQRDNGRLIATLKKLRDLGNTVIVVEHDMETIEQADHIIDMGPAAGSFGGAITATGTPAQCAANANSLTGAYLAGTRYIEVPRLRRTPKKFITLEHAQSNNLKDLTVHFPLGVLCGISGVSGSGKSTLIMEELVPAINTVQGRRFCRLPNGRKIAGTELINYLVVIDQSPIGRTPRSNPATYLGLSASIRALFASLAESNARGYSQSRFSFNVAEGRCAECRGDGTITVSMHFLPDVVTTCKTCGGRRFNKETLSVAYKGKNIADVFDMSAREAAEFFSFHGAIEKRLSLMCDVGLNYVCLGQPSTTLSGGEAQRIKLVNELSKRGSKTLYILDEPTTGLHSSDVEKLLVVLNKLVDHGNSVIVIEHNLDILKAVDYLIDLGPEGGSEGGAIVAAGNVEDVMMCDKSYTAAYLKKVMGAQKR